MRSESGLPSDPRTLSKDAGHAQGTLAPSRAPDSYINPTVATEFRADTTQLGHAQLKDTKKRLRQTLSFTTRNGHGIDTSSEDFGELIFVISRSLSAWSLRDPPLSKMGRMGYTKLYIADSELAEAAPEKPLGLLSTQRRTTHALIYLILLASNALCLSLWWRTTPTDCIRPQLTYCMSDLETLGWRGT